MKYFVMDPPLSNIEILFKILSLPNIAKVMTYYSVWRVCGPYSLYRRVCLVEGMAIVVVLVELW